MGSGLWVVEHEDDSYVAGNMVVNIRPLCAECPTSPHIPTLRGEYARVTHRIKCNIIQKTLRASHFLHKSYGYYIMSYTSCIIGIQSELWISYNNKRGSSSSVRTLGLYPSSARFDSWDPHHPSYGYRVMVIV